MFGDIPISCQPKMSEPGKSQICGRVNLKGCDVGVDATEGVLEGEQARAQPAENCWKGQFKPLAVS